jgi:hypothetical protein
MRKQASLVQIRYNTESDGTSMCWRLLVDGEEILVHGVEINKSCRTTTDWLEDKQCYKHHISVLDCIVTIHPDTLIAIVE